jgi:hypothetical protein
MHFCEEVVDPLEKNCLKVLDPQESTNRLYKKMDYKFDDKIEKILQKTTEIEWTSVIDRVNLSNIHMFHDSAIGKGEIFLFQGDNRNNIAGTVYGRQTFSKKIMQLTTDKKNLK